MQVSPISIGIEIKGDVSPNHRVHKGEIYD